MANAKIIVTRLDNGMPESVYIDAIRSVSAVGATVPAVAKNEAAPAKGEAPVKADKKSSGPVLADDGHAEIHWRTTGLLAVRESQKEVDALIG